MNDDHKNWKNKIDQLKSHPSPLDLGMEWDALERRMNDKKRRRLAVWWWPVMLGLLVGFTYFYKAGEHPVLQKEVKDVKIISIDRNTVAANEEVLTQENVLGNEDQSDVIMTQIRNPKSQKNMLRADIHGDIKVAVDEKQKVDLKASKDAVVLHQDVVPSLIQLELKENSQPTSIQKEDIEITHREQTRGHLIKTFNVNDLHVSQLYPSEIPMQVNISPKNKKTYFVDFRTFFGQPVYTFVPTFKDGENLVSARKKQETPLESFGTRLSFGKEFGSHFYTTVGLSYVRLNDRWQSTVVDTIDKTLDNQVIETYTNQEGLLTEKIGSKSVRQKVEINQTRYNTIQNLSTTISVGRYFKVNKMRWALEANISIPILTSLSGQVSDQNDQMINISDANFDYTTIQYGMHTSYIYPVSGHLAVYGGYDYNFSKLTTDLGYIRKQNIHSLSLGMKYFFNK